MGDVVKKIAQVVIAAVGDIVGLYVPALGAAIKGLNSAIWGGVSIMASNKRKQSALLNSPTYQNILQTQTNPDLPLPLIYGTVKVAGNRIYQNKTSEKKIKRIVAFAEGEVTDFTDIRLNNIESKKVSGIKIEKYYGTSEQELTKIAKLEDVGSLKNVAYLAITCNKTSKIDINYNLTTIIKGRKIRVYSSPNVYEVKYSENPAWILFDFLTSYNGLGLCLNNKCEIDDNLISSVFDLNSFIESAAFCDEEVSYTVKEEDEKGNIAEVIKTSPRFTFNMIFDCQTSARDLIDEIYRSCRGGLFVKNGKLQFKIDKAEPVSQVFTAEDIIKGSETFQLIPNEEHYDILRISFVSPDNEWQKVEAFAELPEYRDGVPIEHNVNCFSVTNFQQASRLAWYYINSKRLCPYFGSFQTDYRAYLLEAGDVIEFDSLLMGLDKYKVKIESINDEGNGVFTINWRNYDERLYSDELGSKEPRVLVSDLSDIAAYPEDVKNFNVVQSQNYFNFVWQLNENPSDTYEIRYGESWDNGTAIGKRITNNNFTWKIPAKGLYKFWIKAFNGYNYSENATLDVYNVNDIPETNIIVSLDVLKNQQGTYENTYNYHNSIKLNPIGEIWRTTDNYWGEDEYYQTLGYWGSLTVASGSYTSQIYDIGDVLESIVSFESQYLTYSESQYVLFEWRYSEDDETWSDWALCNIGGYNFRYYQFRISLFAEENAQIIVNSFKVSIDVPDKEVEMDVEIPEEGSLEIFYNFINRPSIIGTVNDDIEAYIIVPDSTKTNKSAIIKAFKNDGTLTSAKVNLRLKGY